MTQVDEFIRGKDGVRILPYVEINGARTASDDFMVRLFNEMVEQGSLPHVFYQGEVKTAAEFLAFIKNPNNFPLVAFYEEAPASVAWLNNVFQNHAFCHHWFYKHTWGRTAINVARTVIDYWFALPGKDGPFLEVLLGMTPKWNKRAVSFAKRVGFQIVGEIPKIAGGETAVISYLEKQ